jgi:hypothetical protein
MGHWHKGGALLALMLLHPAAFPQEAMPEVRIEPPRRYEPKVGEDFGRPGSLTPGHNVWDRGSPPVLKQQLERQHKFTLQRMQDAAARGNWTQVWEQSQGLDRHTPATESLRLRAARSLLGEATQARARGDWQQVHTVLKPLSHHPSPESHYFNADGLYPLTLPPQKEWKIEPPTKTGTQSASPSRSSSYAGAIRQLQIQADAESGLKDALGSAKTLYGQATVQLAEQALNANDPYRAIDLFREAFAAAPEEATPRTTALLKGAFLSAVSVNYAKRDWQSVSGLCDEVQKDQYFRLTPAETERVSLLQSRSQNWSQSKGLPAATLIVDHLTTGRPGSYFHVFGADGAVDVLVKAASVRELVAHPDFRPAQDRIAQGSDLLLTPAVTRVLGWRESVRHSFPGTTVWSDPYIGEASESLASLQQTKIAPADVALAVLLPKNARQQAAMSLAWTDAQREHTWQAGEYLKSQARGVTLVSQAANRTGVWGALSDSIGTDSKKDVLYSLANSKGVLILFAHGDREGVYTPEGQKLTVEDVRSLDLHKNRPVVLLLSCEGNGRGPSVASASMAQELKKSGAAAVWSYGQKVDAAEASSAGVKFLDHIRSGQTLLESLRSLSRDKAVRAGPEVHLKVELRDLSGSARES